MKQETLPKELFMKLVSFFTEKTQELLDKLKDNTLYDGKCWPSLCIAKAQTEQKTQEEQKTQAEQRTKKMQKMQKRSKKLKVLEVYEVENEQKVHNMWKRRNKPWKPQEASQRADAGCISLSQQPTCTSLSLGTHKKESELYQPFIRITQMIAKMSVDLSQNQCYITGV